MCPNPSSSKLAVILHLYYEEQLPEIITNLTNLNKANIDYDLYITSPQTPLKNLRKIFPTATLLRPQNYGYDIGPFIYALHKINLNNYDYILKLHTKGNTSPHYTLINNRRINNALWGKILWNALLGTPQKICQNLIMLKQNPQIGMLSAEYCVTNSPELYLKFLPQLNQELTRLNLPHTQQFTFVAGTMFLARTKVLKPFLKYNINDFAPTDSKIKEGTLAHIIERLFGAVTETQGYIVTTTPHKSYPLFRLFIALKRFFYQKKLTRSGKTIIKICKIPVYTKP